MALTDKIANIAEAIRAKTGKSDPMTLEQMATEIEGISSGTSTEAVETVSITVETSNFTGMVRYTDKSYGFNELELASESTYSIECIKGSFVAFSGYGFMSDNLQPNFSVDYMYDPNGEGLQVYYFDTNATVTIRNGEGW